jgi:hypothetical protein
LEPSNELKALARVLADWTEGISATVYLYGSPTPLAPNITLADAFYPFLSQATVTITAGLSSGDQLTINGLTSGSVDSIQYHYDSGTGVLTLSGLDSLLNYQTVLRDLEFSSAAADPLAGPAARSFALTATSGDPLAPVTSLDNGPTLTLGVDVADFLANEGMLDGLKSIAVIDS